MEVDIKVTFEMGKETGMEFSTIEMVATTTDTGKTIK